MWKVLREKLHTNNCGYVGRREGIICSCVLQEKTAFMLTWVITDRQDPKSLKGGVACPCSSTDHKQPRRSTYDFTILQRFESDKYSAETACLYHFWEHWSFLLANIQNLHLVRTNQLAYHPGPQPGLWVGPLQHLCHLCAGLHMKGLVFWNKSHRISMAGAAAGYLGGVWWGCSVDGVLETRGLEPDQELIIMANCEQSWLDKRV